MGKKTVNYPDVYTVRVVPDSYQMPVFADFKEWREKQIRKLAGQKWLEAGAPHGRADEFWFAAEVEYEAMEGEPR